MFNIIRDFKWYRIHINITEILGRCYYFNLALFWWIVDLIVFVSIGVSWNLLAVAIPLGIMTLLTTINWIRTLVYYTLSKATILKLDNFLDRGTALEGVPGSGKSSTINSFGLYLARKQWKQLQRDYSTICHIDFESLPLKLKQNYEEVIKAFNYYSKHIDTHIPCLHSIYSIYDKSGRHSYNLSKLHLSQGKRLPFRSVWICDEISSMFPNDLAKKEPKTVQDLKYQWRWIRHFTDSYAICADIRFGDAFLAIRSASGSIISLTKKQKWILKPGLLLFVKKLWDEIIDFNFWMYSMYTRGSKSFFRIENSLINSSKHSGKIYSWLNKLINCIGYRKYFYTKSGTKDNGVADEYITTQSGCYYLKSCLDVNYNDRVFKNLYKPINEEFVDPDSNNDWFPSKEVLQKTTGINDV